MTNENQEQLKELLRELQTQDFDEPYEYVGIQIVCKDKKKRENSIVKMKCRLQSHPFSTPQ